MTGYVATRWYRAPEIMLNWMQYNNKGGRGGGGRRVGEGREERCDRRGRGKGDREKGGGQGRVDGVSHFLSHCTVFYS